ncbi:MAG: hypothetical protein NXI16_05300 [Alphaproteobacteria bacterium]|nr:hypothetical protein [Alphaproteobacteria bacterium]
MTQSLSDVIDTIVTKGNDETSALFYPVLVLAQPLPVLDPLAVSGTVDFGDLSQISGTLAQTLCTDMGGGTATSATMTLTNVSVSGLANGVLGNQSVSGNDVSMTVTLGGASVPTGLVLEQPTITGSFSIAIDCGKAETISGTFTMGLGGAVLTLKATVDGSYNVSVTSLTCAVGSLTTHTFTLEQPADPTAQVKIANDLGSALAANPGVFSTVINKCLAQSSVTSALNKGLTAYVQSVAKPSLLSFTVSLLYKMATNASSDYYMPTVIKNASDPTLEPYTTTNSSWSIGSIGDFASSAVSSICGASAPGSESWIGTPGAPAPLTLENIVISGLSNALPQPLMVIGDNVTGLAIVGQVPSWQYQFELSGTFTLKLSCCPTTNFQTCSGASQPQTGTGTFTATIKAAALGAFIAIGTDSHDNLTGTVKGLRIQSDPNVTDAKNIVFKVDATSIPKDKGRDSWNEYIDNTLNTTQATTVVLQRLQAEINSQSILDQLSKIVTKALANVLAEQAAAEKET